MKVLVTGSTGFVGRHLVPELARGHDVCCVVRPGSRSSPEGTDVVEADLATPGFDRLLPSGMDAIVHLAQAYATFPDDAQSLFAVNAASTQWLAEYARRVGVSRFVFTSSGSVYHPSRSVLTEHDPPDPVGYHPATKLMGEMLLRFYRPSFGIGILRLFAPYGAGQENRLLPRLVEAVETGQPITLSRGGEPRINPIYIDDLVRLIGDALVDTRSYTVNIAGPEPVSIRDLALMIGAHAGRDPVFIVQDGEVEGDFVADTTLMHRLFTVGSLIAPSEGIGRMVSAQLASASGGR